MPTPVCCVLCATVPSLARAHIVGIETRADVTCLPTDSCHPVHPSCVLYVLYVVELTSFALCRFSR